MQTNRLNVQKEETKSQPSRSARTNYNLQNQNKQK